LKRTNQAWALLARDAITIAQSLVRIHRSLEKSSQWMPGEMTGEFLITSAKASVLIPVCKKDGL
jgi:hypothetical protein